MVAMSAFRQVLTLLALTAVFAGCGSSNKKLDMVTQTYDRQISQADTEIEGLKNILVQQKQQIDSLQGTVSSLNQQLEEQKRASQQQVSSLQQAHNQLKSSYDESQRAAGDLAQGGLVAIGKKISELEDRSQSNSRDTRALQASLQDAKTELDRTIVQTRSALDNRVDLTDKNLETLRQQTLQQNERLRADMGAVSASVQEILTLQGRQFEEVARKYRDSLDRVQNQLPSAGDSPAPAPTAP